MPIYEYICSKCAEEFEAIVQGEQRASCPSCSSSQLQKKFSGFAVGNGAPVAVGAPAGPCGSCGHPRGPGACALD